MRYFIDAEFDGNIDNLISFAIVSEIGRSQYVIMGTEATVDPWVAENVIPVLYKSSSQPTLIHESELGDILREFIGEDTSPFIFADSPNDVAIFTKAWSKNRNGGYCPNSKDTMRFIIQNIDSYPSANPDLVQHNAWTYAKRIRGKAPGSGPYVRRKGIVVPETRPIGFMDKLRNILNMKPIWET